MQRQLAAAASLGGVTWARHALYGRLTLALESRSSCVAAKPTKEAVARVATAVDVFVHLNPVCAVDERAARGTALVEYLLRQNMPV
jgi:hypothetical protein